MGYKLVVVESPAKAKTIGKILGRGYKVVASMGHVRDLPRTALGIDIEAGFAARYVNVRKKKKTIQQLKEAAQAANAVYLATDLDREGEAIAWHVLRVLRLPKAVPVYRVTFHEITPAAIQAAFDRCGTLNDDLVEAQQARRVLDRLVGYKISPLLWKRVKGGPRGLSAGRVQTAALRLVVEREREIEAFDPVEYWTIEALLAQQIPDPLAFLAQLYRIGKEKPELKNRDDAQQIVDALEEAIYWVESVETRRRGRKPPPPFTTSTMQQTASSRLGWSPSSTMRVAQQLYEGVKLGDEGQVGLITYMRTDSTYIAPPAQAAARELIAELWGQAYLPPKARVYKTKVKSAQEAHEAIRPTDVRRTPKQVEPFLDKRQAMLYRLIWQRFVASQMANAVYDVTTVLIPTGRGSRDERLPYLFRARGRVLVFDGFLKVYADKKGDEEEAALPKLTDSEDLDLLELIPTQHWTQPPPRYTEASLIKELEKRGIGRPSTFASMVKIIQDRDYARREKRNLLPTPLGFGVCDLLLGSFPNLFDYDFTARLEDQLDEIAEGRVKRLAALMQFWSDFEPALTKAESDMPTVKIVKPPPEPTGENCPECGQEMVLRQGRYGPFVGCSAFPKCRYIQKQAPEKTGAKCPHCDHDMVVKKGRRGPFVACSNYPDCKHIDREASKALKKG